ncbi:MAG: hypothetical protein H6815_04815 [Phycisphaeraceae bacterium]|nr:hypothetical protein [Phycisphaerales bacterium]MCB9859756.1 hypothetical protein [Phycisphaeraceae bacterium]
MTTNTAAIVIVSSIALICLLALVRAVWRLQRAVFSNGKCAKCGFSREGLPDADAVCPECGTAPNRRSAIVRMRLAIVGVIMTLVGTCGWLIAEWAVGPVWSDRVALMWNPPLTAARYERLESRIPFNSDGGRQRNHKLDSRARLYAEYAAAKFEVSSQRVDETNGAAELLEQIAGLYTQGGEYVARLLLASDLGSHHMSLAVACSPDTPDLWNGFNEWRVRSEPVFNLLMEIQPPRARYGAFHSVLLQSPDGFIRSTAPVREFAVRLQYASMSFRSGEKIDPLFFGSALMVYMLVSCDDANRMVDICICENSIASDVVLVCGIARLDEYIRRFGVGESAVTSSRFPVLDENPLCYESAIARVKEYFASLDPDRRSQIIDITSAWSAKCVNLHLIQPLESYFPD